MMLAQKPTALLAFMLAASTTTAAFDIQHVLNIPIVPVPPTSHLPSFASTPLTHTQQSLRDTSSAGITELLTYVNGSIIFSGLGWWQSANAYTAIFDHDWFTHSRSFRNSAGNDLLRLISQGQPDGDKGLINVYNDDSLWWALACLDAYAAYGDSRFTATAGQIWDWVRSTSQVVKTGVAPDMGGVQREYVLSDSCALENGVYWTTFYNETYVNSITTGLFLQTSARLYEVFHDKKFLAAAEGALEWLDTHTVDSKVLVSEDGVNGTTCDIHSGAYTYNTGVFIGGLVSLWRGTGNATYLSEAETAGASAMETTLWTDGNGFITESDGATADSDGAGFRSILIRDLMQLYLATSSAALKQEIKGFVNTNFNALYTKARRGNAYGGDWSGPFVNKTSWGQFVAIDVLNAAMLANGGA